MIIDLADNLKPTTYGYRRKFDDVKRATIPPVQRDRYTKVSSETERFLRSSLPDDAEYHANYMTYLIAGWSQHFSIVINPDIVWFAILNEIAKGVIETPDEHRSLFTRNPYDKITIMVPVGEFDEPLPLDAVLQQLTDLVPMDVGLFVPKFTTTTDMARLAHLASFAETCSPYYSYMTYMCGYPKIRVDGTVEDYDFAMGRAIAIFNAFDRIGSPLAPWMAQIMLPWLSNIADAVHNADAGFFRKILSTKQCGSGGEIEVNGWWTALFRNQPTGVRRKPDNFPTQIARVPWKNLETKCEFTLNCGVFHSKLDADGFMLPEFGWIQNEMLAA